jgi:hypothetical protein
MPYADKLKTILEAMGREEEFKAICERQTEANGTIKEVHSHSLQVSGDKAYLIPLSDLHVGHVNFNVEKALGFVKYILNTPDTYTILLGDQAECSNRFSIGKPNDVDMDSDEQLDILTQMLEPLAKAGKIWGVHIGNHEYRFPRDGCNNPAQMLAKLLRVPYLSYQGFHVIDVKGSNGIRQRYTMHSTHGVGSATTMAQIIASSEKPNKIYPTADLYINGHLHAKDHHVDTVYTISDKGILVPHTRHYVVCGNFIEYWESYADMKLMQPHATGAVKISFSAEKKEIEVKS